MKKNFDLLFIAALAIAVCGIVLSFTYRYKSAEYICTYHSVNESPNAWGCDYVEYRTTQNPKLFTAKETGRLFWEIAPLTKKLLSLKEGKYKIFESRIFWGCKKYKFQKITATASR